MSDSALKAFYIRKIENLEHMINEKSQNLKRMEAQRNELNNQGRSLLFLPFIQFESSETKPKPFKKPALTSGKW